MKAEIVSVGTELLLGEINDTNATYICQQLTQTGIDVHLRHTVDDDQGRIVQVLQEVRRRSQIVITTGGLGPTPDDLTREALAQVTGRPLYSIAAAEQQLKEFFATRGLMPTANNLKQCQVPRGAGFWRITVALPPEYCWSTRTAPLLLCLARPLKCERCLGAV